ncbi:soluble lytic murein transglycosylase-like protein [Devosia sp. UYZn731]|uniref:lytic transglycosylase domain-containing protein n=1 Tax=Devosia sp. UYZn731 TaxID=3156345 RepID=UPI003395ED3B
MRQTAITVAGVALLSLAVSGCSMSSFKMAPGPTAALAAPKPAPQHEAAEQAAAAEEHDSNPLAGLLAFASPNAAPVVQASFAPTGPSRPAIDPLIAKYASAYNVPERLIRRVIVRESGYNPGARNGPYFGLMQISHATARGMGYSGSPGGLLDADTNLRYAAKYLAGAYVTARGNEDQAMRFYASGYYYDAKRAGLLEEAGLR